MKNVNFLINILNKGWSYEPVSALVFSFYRESFRILPKLITSNLNQRLTTQPNDLLNIQSCANLRVLTGTAFYFIVCLIMVLLQGVI